MTEKLKKIWRFYADGFKSMTVGRQLWLLILVKVLILFGVLKLFFFPNILEKEYENDSERASAVRSVLTSRGSNPQQPLD